ncbi:MAG: copper resistance protein NlpE N-terminal domain-containing protein [Saprospiraceae bacterium]|nr:copper resistance protein NlpE N-terminal domain-containing protein [Saprospiraceae bacterium]
MPLIYISLLLMGFTGLHACGGQQTADRDEAPPRITVENPPDMHDAAISLDYTGIYKGVLPGVDGVDQEVELELTWEMNFTLKTPGSGSAEKARTGFYSFQKHGAIITLIGVDPPHRFFVGENYLVPLDAAGHTPAGGRDARHALKKQKSR